MVTSLSRNTSINSSHWFKYLPLKKGKVLWTFQNIKKLTGGGRTIFQMVMGLDWGRQEKDLTQFQVSTAHSDSCDQKTKQVAGDTRLDIITRVYVPRYAKIHCISSPSIDFNFNEVVTRGSTATFSRPPR
jgi:hypothetical protein